MVNILLRKIEPSDLPFLYQWENDAASWADGANHNPLSQQDLRDYIASTTGDIYRDGQLRLIIEQITNDQSLINNITNDQSPITNATLGCLDLFDFDPRNRRAAIGMYIAPEARGNGVGRQALEQLEQYAFGHLNLRVLYAVIATSNAPCSALFRSAGYTPSSPLSAWTLESDAILWLKTK
ncbi:MAG: GNAT family N-acetyltransferase [Bacteroidales bacterium]|nr:GNAT family N-acetyltransferase [Bacteroidales bacterium]MDY6405549.1 GNAT family N-acetyltransferase [Bacteroidales bacterium]